MKIRIVFHWYRDNYHRSSCPEGVILDDVKASKLGVTQAIRNYAKDWTGRGYLELIDITASYANEQQYCDIAQTKFNFNN